MSIMGAVARQPSTANFFQLCNLSGKTKITYYPAAPGHAAQSGASLQYEGPEGQWMFDGEEIAHEDTSLGQLISVELRPEGASSSRFWFFLPPVVMTGDPDFQSFTTYGVKNGGVERPGKPIDYQVERFFGDAKAY